MTIINDSNDWTNFLTTKDLGNWEFNEEEVKIGETILEFPFTSEDAEEAVEETRSDYYFDQLDDFVYEDLTEFC
jgi:hypothetical protein